jgi:hypothetical protein
MQLHLTSLIYLALLVMPQIPVDSACVQSIVKPSDPVSNGITPSDFRPITKAQRTNWFIESVVGPESLAAGLASASWGTALDRPRDYGPHISGFAQRYVMRLPEVAMGNLIEAGLGAVWQEDPRYNRSGQGKLWHRVRHAATMTVLAYRSDGHAAPAYARYAGIVGENFIANGWRVDSERSANTALTQSALGFAGRFAGNLFGEFWNDVRKKVRHRK